MTTLELKKQKKALIRREITTDIVLLVPVLMFIYLLYGFITI